MAPKAVPKTGWRRFRWPIVAAVVLATAGTYAYVARPWQSRFLQVTTETVMPGPVVRVLAVSGRVAARRSVVVRSAVPGKLLVITVEEGELVVAGQIIATIDDSQPRAQAAQARAALGAGLTNLQKAQADAARAHALGQNASRKTLEEADLTLSAAQYEIDRLRRALDQIESILAQYRIAAPMSGTVLIRSVDPGQVIDTQSDLLTVADLTQLIVKTDVDEIYAAQIKEGLSAVLKPAGFTSTLAGKVSFASPMVSAATGGRAVEIAFDKAISLPVGLTVMVNIVVDQQPAAISVPRAAIVRTAAGTAVFVVDNGKAVMRPVVVIDWPSNRLIVTEGLVPGARVIVDAAMVTDGSAVRVR